MAAAKKSPWWVRVWFFSLLVLAVLYAIPSIAYPLGREQAASFYVAREWWEHNLIPYRDAFDVRTPGIHFIYMLANAIFGAHPYSIRILELVALLGGGSAIAKAGARRQLSPLEIAPAILLFVGCYFAFVDYAGSAQAEIWEALCLVAAQSTISMDKNRRRAAIVAGLWTGCAVVFKPQAIFLVPVLFGQSMTLAIADRPEPEKAPAIVETTAAYSLGFVQPPAAFAAYFATRNSTSQFYECILSKMPPADSWLTTLHAFWAHTWLLLVSAAVLWVVGLFLRSKQDKPPKLWFSFVAPVSLLFAVVSVCSQGSADSNAWVVLIPFVVFCAADGLIALGRVWMPLPTVLAVGLVALFHFGGPSWASNPAVTQRTETGRFWGYAFGKIDRDAYLSPTFQGTGDYVYRDEESLGNRIRELAQPNDLLHVRGREPALYAVSGLHSPSRFFARDDPKDDAVLETQPPRFFVTRAAASDADTDTDELSRRGYHQAAHVGSFILFSR